MATTFQLSHTVMVAIFVPRTKTYVLKERSCLVFIWYIRFFPTLSTLRPYPTVVVKTAQHPNKNYLNPSFQCLPPFNFHIMVAIFVPRTKTSGIYAFFQLFQLFVLIYRCCKKHLYNQTKII